MAPSARLRAALVAIDDANRADPTVVTVGERSVPKEIVFGALESALASATKRLFAEEDVEIRVAVDAGVDEGDADTWQAAALNRSMQGLARAVSLDPDDKMGL